MDSESDMDLDDSQGLNTPLIEIIKTDEPVVEGVEKLVVPEEHNIKSRLESQSALADIEMNDESQLPSNDDKEIKPVIGGIEQSLTENLSTTNTTTNIVHQDDSPQVEVTTNSSSSITSDDVSTSTNPPPSTSTIVPAIDPPNTNTIAITDLPTVTPPNSLTTAPPNSSTNPTNDNITLPPNSSNSSIRYQTLVELSTRCLEESIKYLTLDRVLACYPTIAKYPKAKPAMEQALKQVTEFWYRTSQKEFKAIFEERDIKNKLGELEQLIKEATARRAIPKELRQPDDEPVLLGKLTPERIVECNIRQTKIQRIAKLKAQLLKVREENTKLQTNLKLHEQELSSLVETMQRSLKDLESAVSAVNQLPERTDLAAFVSTITQ